MNLIMADVITFVVDGIATGSSVYYICFIFILFCFLFILFYFRF